MVGLGNPLRRDDGAGIVASRRLRATLPPSIVVRESSADVAELLEVFAAARQVILIDAVPDLPEGQVCRLAGPDFSLPSLPSTSSHALTLTQIIDLGRALDQLPASLLIYGIGASDFGPGEGLSAKVEAAVTEVVQRITAELS